jgi:hypothetical protein
MKIRMVHHEYLARSSGLVHLAMFLLSPGGRIPSMKALRMISVLSVLPLMVIVDVWTWLEDGLARLGARHR